MRRFVGRPAESRRIDTYGEPFAVMRRAIGFPSMVRGMPLLAVTVCVTERTLPRSDTS